MKTPSLPSIGAARVLAFAALLGASSLAGAATSLTDQPVFATSNVPGNLALALSVEWPTASRTAHTANYTSASTYLGYFDPNKCYTYTKKTAANPVIPANGDGVFRGDSSYFKPTGVATGRKCTGTLDAMWSGNFLNWAATATIDPFRWAMTGGRRVVDEMVDGVETTILEKGWHGDRGLFDDRDLTASEIAGATPFDAASKLTVQVRNRGFAMRLVASGGALKAAYFNNKDLSGTPVVTLDNDSADHDWGGGSPATGVNADGFSARFTGTYTAPETGNYTFRVTGDDGVRLWINGTQVIDAWKDQGPTAYDATVSLTAGQSFDVKIEYFENGGGAVMQFAWKRPSAANVASFTSDIGASTTNDYTMRNQVCDPSAPGGVESNCKQYGSAWKPEGLIQQYSQRMRFSAFGYLNDSSDQRDGGVMRASQKFVGPKQPVPGLPDATNTENEWDLTTGRFVQNPNSADALATTAATGIAISDSGVVNYLNKFGQILPGNYKDYDPVSEMYYAVLRYYKNLGNVASWSNLNTTDTNTKRRYLDGFPVITDWKAKDPVQYSCQRNFVLGIGDIYTHVDKNVPGNTDYRTREPGMPSEFNDYPDTVNAVTATNKVGALQGVGNIGSTDDYSGRNNSAYIAGLAYDANTTDIRPDDNNFPQTKGKQTVQTYWVDVLEQDFQANNQFYLASKYGGLKVPDDFLPYAAAPADIQKNWWATTGDTLTDTRTNTVQPRPDNYFTAGRPDTMVDGLTRAFASIANAIKAYTTSFSLSTVQVSSLGAASYASQYDSDGWTGVLSASEITFDKDGNPSKEARWTSAGAFETQLAGSGWDADRRVVTWDPAARVGTPFRKDSLTAAQFDLLNTPWDSPNADDRADFLNYLRGDRSKEKTNSLSALPYRHRNALLGDIVDAKVTPVAPPLMRYSESINPGYAAFKTEKAARPTMVYVGANDGMLHAFNGGLSGANAGKEQFAYVPSALFAGPTGQTTINGLVQLGNPTYEHHYYVNATPQAFDIDFKNAGDTFTSTTKETSEWHSVLIGGLGKGGKSFYAIDITDPGDMTTEAVVKDKVLWEFTASTMGYSFGAPNVIKTKKYGWVVVLTSGYNNSDGFGYIYFVNPRNGALLEAVRTPTASTGLAQATAYIKDFTDGTADAIYAGDLDGQVWRFDVTAERSVSGPYPAPVKIATVADASANPQPITAQPLVEIDPKSRKRFVMFGTGQLLDSIDIKSSAAQTFYAFEDGTANMFGAATGRTRANFKAVTNDDLISTTPIDFADKTGWYLELGSTANVGWRVVSNPTSYNGVVAFASLLTTGTACSPSGQSAIFAIKFGSAASALTTPEGVPTSFIANDAAITDLKFLGVDGKARLIGGDVEGKLRKLDIQPGGGTGVRLLNWREVPTVD